MKKSKKNQLISFLILIIFFTIFAATATLDAGDITGEYGFEVDTESVGSTATNIDMDDAQSDKSTQSVATTDIVEYVEPMTDEQFEALIDATMYGGSIALAYGTGDWSVPASAAADSLYPYTTSMASGTNEMEIRKSGLNSFIGGFAGPTPTQVLATETLTYLQDNTPNYNAPTNNPNRGAELTNTRPALQR